VSTCSTTGPCDAMAARMADGTVHLHAGHVHIGVMRLRAACPWCGGDTRTATVAAWQWAHLVPVPQPREPEAA